MTQVTLLEQRENGVEIYEMRSQSMRMIVSNLGCHVLEIQAPDRENTYANVVLGFADVEDCHHDGSYMGAVVGRVANRIGGASFQLNGKQYALAANNGVNHLHGGLCGFNQKIFQTQIVENGIEFSYLSPDGEEGYPGNLHLQVLYQLKDQVFSIEYRAVCDQDTLANFTNHMYFNLSGNLENVEGHELRVCADQIACVDKNCLADGTFLDVENTPFDFRSFHKIGERIRQDHIQLQNAGGYDHAFLLNAAEKQVTLRHPASGRALTISTTLPTVQVYTGNFLANGCMGRHGRAYNNREGVALETQLLPNSIHIEKNPAVILRKNQVFHAKTSYCFTVE